MMIIRTGLRRSDSEDMAGGGAHRNSNFEIMIIPWECVNAYAHDGDDYYGGHEGNIVHVVYEDHQFGLIQSRIGWMDRMII